MSDISVAHSVQFLGAWRTKVIDDGLMSTIAKQIKQLPKLPTRLKVASSGLELVIFNKNGEITRTDRLPIQNVLDFINNKYSSVCLLAIVKGKENHFTVFTFLFKNEKEAAQMLRAFKAVKHKLSGEGYNFDLKSPRGRNWVLKSETSSQRVPNGEVKVIKQGQGQFVNGNAGEARVIVGQYNTTRTDKEDGNHPDERTSHASVTTTSSEVKDELLHLSEEVRAIKQMLAGQSRERSPDSLNRRATSPVRPQRYVWDQTTRENEITTSPTQVVHFDSYAQPVYRRTTYNPQRRDFGPGFVIARSKKSMSPTKGHVTHPSVRYGSTVLRQNQGHFVDGPERLVYQRSSPPQRPAVIRVRSNPVSPASTTIRRSIEEVYRPRAYSGSRGKRPIILISPPPAEQIAVARASGVERHLYKEPDLTTEHVHATVTEHIPIEVEPRVKEVYKVERTSNVEAEPRMEAEIKTDEHDEESRGEDTESPTENDSRIVNISVVESSDRLLQIQNDLEAVENNNADQIFDRQVEDEEARDEKVTIIRRESFEEQPPETTEEDERELVRHSVLKTYGEENGDNNDDDDDDCKADSGVSETEDTEHRSVKRVTILEDKHVLGEQEVREDTDEDGEEDEDEEPYVMDEERFRAFTSEPDIVIIEKSDKVENDLNRNGRAYGNGPTSAVLEKSLNFDDEDDEDIVHDVMGDFQKSKGTSHATYVVETLANDESDVKNDVMKTIETGREAIDTDVWRTEDTVLF